MKVGSAHAEELPVIEEILVTVTAGFWRLYFGRTMSSVKE
jgi:hypothetical protein